MLIADRLLVLCDVWSMAKESHRVNTHRCMLGYDYDRIALLVRQC